MSPQALGFNGGRHISFPFRMVALTGENDSFFGLTHSVLVFFGKERIRRKTGEKGKKIDNWQSIWSFVSPNVNQYTNNNQQQDINKA